MRDLEAVDDRSAAAGSSLSGMATAASVMGAAAIAAAGAVLTLTQRTADMINDLGDMSARTGTATKTLKGLELAARGSGAQLSDLEGVLRKATSQGLDFEQVAAHIQSIEDPTARTAEAMRLLGEEGGRLVQVLGDTSVAQFAEFAETFGRDTGPEAAAAAAEWQRSTAALQTVLEGLTDTSGSLPLMNSLIKDFTAGVVIVGEVAPAAFIVAQEHVLNLAGAVGALLVAIGEADTALRTGDFGALAGIAEDVETAWAAARQQQQDLSAELDAALAKGIEKAETLNTSLTAMGGDDGAAGGLSLAADEAERLATGLDEANKQNERLVQQSEAIAEYAASWDTVQKPVAAFVGKTSDGVDAQKDLEKQFKSMQKAANMQKVSKGITAVSTGLGVAADLTGALGGAMEAFSGTSEKAQKRAFAVNKAAAIGGAIVSTAQGIAAALPLGPVAGPIYATAAGIAGALQIATIAATTFEGGGSAPTPATLPTPAELAPVNGSDFNGTSKGGDDGGTRRFYQRGRSQGTSYRHRDMDVVAADSYPDSAFDDGGSTGQARGGL